MSPIGGRVRRKSDPVECLLRFSGEAAGNSPDAAQIGPRHVTPTGFGFIWVCHLQTCHPYGVRAHRRFPSINMPPLRGSGASGAAFLQTCHPYGVQVHLRLPSYKHATPARFTAGHSHSPKSKPAMPEYRGALNRQIWGRVVPEQTAGIGSRRAPEPVAVSEAAPGGRAAATGTLIVVARPACCAKPVGVA